MTSDSGQGGFQEPGGMPPGGMPPGEMQPGGPPPPPPPPGAAPYQYEGQPGYGQAPKTESTAVAALVVGVVGLFILGIILGIVALVLANSANKKIEQSGGARTGKGLVTGARILGVLDIVFALVLITVLVAS